MTQIFNRSLGKQKRQQLRRTMNECEVILWVSLKGKGLGNYRFRRQYGIGRYVTDFYCPKAKLVIEIDGGAHLSDDAKEYDKVRDDFIQVLGLRILRFKNADVLHNLPAVLKSVAKALEEATSLRRRGNGGGQSVMGKEG